MSPGCRGCIYQPNSPNGNAAVDSAVSVIAHELAEAATDPLQTGWFFKSGSGLVENADQCTGYFPNAKRLANGTNIAVGGRNYYIQANWNLSAKACRMA